MYLQADIDSYEYARGHAGSARIQRTVEVHPSNPLHHRIWNGTCKGQASVDVFHSVEYAH